MSDTAPVSVIVPTLNAAKYLDVAIDSVERQRPRPEEILVIDGGSQDGSAEIAASRHGVRVVRQAGRGLAAARNEAIRAASCALIAFCDADDRWSDDALAVRLRALERHPNASAVIGRIVLESLEGTAATAAQVTRIGRSVPGFTPGALLIPRETFELVGAFDETLSIGADSDWFVRLQTSPRPTLQIDAVVLYKGARNSSLSTDVGAYRRELLTVARRFIASRRVREPR